MYTLLATTRECTHVHTASYHEETQDHDGRENGRVATATATLWRKRMSIASQEQQRCKVHVDVDTELCRLHP